jgi:uncharacterized protein DUF5666
MTSQTSRTLLVLSLAAALAACGGSSDPGAGPGPGTTPNVTMKGVITARATGQITVNGVALATPATVQIEKVPSPAGELQLGMVVTVRADVSGRSGEATEVEFEDVVKGKVSEVNDDSTLRVGGQLVRVDDSTEFEDNLARLGSVGVDDRVRVSGVPDDKGGLRATRIDRLPGTAEDFEVKGVVSGLSTTGFTLKTSIDAAPADTYTVTLAAGVTFPAGLANGSFVEVRSAAPVQAGNLIEAASISLEDRLGDAQSEAEVEGIVTSATSGGFVVAGVQVTTTDATLWDGGVAADLIPGVKVEAEGTLQADGSLAARKVSFRYSSRLQGPVAGLAVAADGTGTFTVNGITVRVDALTEQRDPASALQAGDLVEVRGFLGRDGTSLVATRLELSNDDRPIIQGVATAKDAAAGTVTILGKTIATGSVESGGFHDLDPSSGVDGPSISKDAFFAAITVGETVVKGRGRDLAAFADPVLNAKEVELEGER